MTLKKSHKWEEIGSVYMRCPHCGKWFQVEGDYMEGNIVNCQYCLEDFELGRQRD